MTGHQPWKSKFYWYFLYYVKKVRLQDTKSSNTASGLGERTHPSKSGLYQKIQYLGCGTFYGPTISVLHVP